MDSSLDSLSTPPHLSSITGSLRNNHRRGRPGRRRHRRRHRRHRRHRRRHHRLAIVFFIIIVIIKIITTYLPSRIYRRSNPSIEVSIIFRFDLIQFSLEVRLRCA